MATTALTGRTVHNFSGDVVVVPQSGLPERAVEGAIVLEGEVLYIRAGNQWNKVTMTPVPETPVVVVSDAAVAGAGSVGCNGDYVNQTPDEWKKPNAAWFVSRIANYPQPGATAWSIRQDERIFYTAPDGPDPWNKTWTTASFGTLPVPTVEKA